MTVLVTPRYWGLAGASGEASYTFVFFLSNRSSQTRLMHSPVTFSFCFRMKQGKARLLKRYMKANKLRTWFCSLHFRKGRKPLQKLLEVSMLKKHSAKLLFKRQWLYLTNKMMNTTP